jgi:hypothetical protein
MIANSIIRTKERDLWWITPQRPQSSHLTSSTWEGDLERAVRRAKKFAPMSTAQGLSQANAKVDSPMRGPSGSTVSHHPNPSIPATPTASIYPPHQLNEGNDMLLSPHFHASPSFLSDIGSSQHIQEDTSTVSQTVTVGATTIPSDHEGQTAVVGTDSGSHILPDPLHIEERESVNYTKNVVEGAEPEELENRSSTPPPKIFARSATDDVFRYVPQAAKGTLQDAHDIELVVMPDTK